MPKPLKRTILLLLAVVIVAAAPLIANASPRDSETSMETALIAAKTLINIDDNIFTDFSYSSSYSNFETREGLIWWFSWSDNANGYISAQVREDGTLLNYWKYDYQRDNYGFAEVSRSAAITIADDFIRKAKPDSYSYFKTPVDVQVSIQDSDYRISYFAEVNGYSFEAAFAGVNVNKFSGEVTGYSTSNANPRNYNFEAATGIISESAAVEAYAEKIGLSLEYRSFYDYENEALKVFPVYLFNSYGDRYISARTGNVVEYVYDLGSDGAIGGSGSDMAMSAPEAEANDGSGRQMLTPAEINAIERAGSFLTREQALANLLEAMDITDIDVDSFDERHISLDRDYINKDRYFYDIYLYTYYGWDVETRDNEIRYIGGRVDAESGRVVRFSLDYYGIPSSGETEYTDEQAAAAIDAFLRKMAPDEYAKTETDDDQMIAPYNIGGDYNTNRVRYENGIAFRNNGISVSYNIYTGKITRYNLNWFDNIRFPSISNVLTPQSALSAYVNQNGSSIVYVTTGNGNAGLVYDFATWGLIDPFNGRSVDYNGEPSVSDAVSPNYSDVVGHWSESVVMRLLDNGVYLWGGRFEPERVMTEGEFLQYLLLSEGQYYFRGLVETAAFYAQRGVNVNADPNKALTRQEAVRIIVEFLGYGRIAEQSEWFVYPFTDYVDESYKGYVTICYMLGLIGGNEGRFNASDNITRAHAAVILQNVILLKR